MLRNTIQALAQKPAVFDLLRSVLEGGFRGHRQVIQEYLCSRPGTVLDVGCGTGVYAPHFKPECYTGVDISAPYIDAASAKFPDHRFQVMDAMDLKFEDHQFDAAFISGVLHHLCDQDAEKLLQEIRRVVHPKGRIVIWEDIPAAAWNVVGHLIHALDLGRHIRSPDQYLKLIAAVMPVRESRRMRSGCMDYVVVVCGD